ncbi:MAG: hypothetical protein U9R74_16190 [Pseudomonadota bacterium]|nr:hypothetical protein [Pseudomonadota bacterium]
MKTSLKLLLWALLPLLPHALTAGQTDPETQLSQSQPESYTGSVNQATRAGQQRVAPVSRFGQGGTVDDVNLNDRRIVIGDELFYLDPNVRVYTQGLTTALPRQIDEGTFVLFNVRQSGGQRLVTEVWMVPERVRREFLEREDDD